MQLHQKINNLKMLHSIQNIEKIFDTGDKPVLVECSDLNAYVCKHNNGRTPAMKLFVEWISHGLLSGFQVPLASRELVQIKQEHVIGTANCQPVFFKNMPLFATRFLEEALEWSQFNLKDQKLITNKNDLIKIAIFDLWMGNEDRSFNNFNLLTHSTEKGLEIVPIDHGACLNSLMFSDQRKLHGISYNESLIDTDEFRILVKPILKNLKDADDFINSLYVCMPESKKIYDEQVLAIPKEWNIPKSFIDELRENLFHKEWLSETKSHFLSYIKSSLKLK